MGNTPEDDRVYSSDPEIKKYIDAILYERDNLKSQIKFLRYEITRHHDTDIESCSEIMSLRSRILELKSCLNVLCGMCLRETPMGDEMLKIIQGAIKRDDDLARGIKS